MRSTRCSADFGGDDQNDGKIQRKTDHGEGQRDRRAHFSEKLECFQLSSDCYIAVVVHTADVVHVAVIDFTF